ncbi:DNA cytosine methyltransferase [Streptomyces tateyamensis]|uniref:DNA cytosine methyltransferase n=1 Tax=Streptomyces tateyamensis TaxID=565073 RepID=A0A2V4NJ24_9ACTN|nr:DNA cytosine methyltransferase [Streptomyces tateyamensis]
MGRVSSAPGRQANGLTVLDLFCCAGGAGMGYHLAGFEVTGVDKEPQPNYPFTFVQADALEYAAQHAHRFDLVHASPPCQHYAAVTRWRGSAEQHPNLIAPTRDLLTGSGRPWVMENVPGSPVRPDLLLCGSMFGLRVRRHRLFETSWHAFQLTAPCHHHPGQIPFAHKDERAFADAMGCTWMSNLEARQAIPPAYTQHIGHQAAELLGATAPDHVAA